MIQGIARSIVVAVIVAFGLPVETAPAAEYFGRTSANVRITDANGAPLAPSTLDTTFVEATTFAETTAPSLTFAQADGTTNGFDTVLTLAGASVGTASQVNTRWLGGMLVQSSANISVLVSVSHFTVVAGKVAVPEEIASAAVTLDLLFGAVDPACVDASGATTRGIGVDCFDTIVRIPVDDQHGVALPNFLTHTTVLGDTRVDLVVDLVEGTPMSATPLSGGGELQAVIGISANTSILIGLEVTAAGEAGVTDVPHCFGKVATIVGTEGNDDIRGTPRDDVILGLGGDDVIAARQGNDLICAGDGDDRITGHDDDDRIAGEGGNDTIDGYYGNDFVWGGPGDDFIQGCDGTDFIDGGPGADTLRGERGRDLILGGTGNDNIKGAAGRDVVIGGQDVSIDVTVTLDDLAGGSLSIEFQTTDESDDDQVNGDRNDDIVQGGPGDDILKGDKGDDIVVGGSGVDTLFGGGGSRDTCVDGDIDTTFAECETQ